MPLFLSKLTVEGFRGINRKLALPLAERANLIRGPNGAGKTSLLQAVEWCLTGTLPHLRGAEFRREDALVNLFHPKKTATVTLELTDGKTTVLVTRKRRMGKSTTVGTTTLELIRGKKLLEGEEAQAELERLLGLPLDEFPRALHLHQEAIRELVSEDPEERSRAIDRLLGMMELRELTETLDVKRKIANAICALEERINGLNRDKIQLASHLRERVEQRGRELREAGYDVEKLTPASLAEENANLQKRVSALAERMSLKVHELRPPPAYAQGRRSLAPPEDAIHALERSRVNALQGLEQRHFDAARQEVADFRGQTFEALAEELKKAGEEISELRKAIQRS